MNDPRIVLTATSWQQVLIACEVRQSTADAWSQVFADTIQADSFSQGQADLLDFLPTVLHESARLEKLVENLNYSAPRMMAVWPSRFPTLASAQPYVGKPMDLANKVYGGRYGNSQPGDGWLYRGRGLIMVTFKDNYSWLTTQSGQDLVGIPDLMAQPHFALEFAISWWEGKVGDSILGQTAAIRRVVNGGQVGIQDVDDLTTIVRAILPGMRS